MGDVDELRNHHITAERSGWNKKCDQRVRANGKERRSLHPTVYIFSLGDTQRSKGRRGRGKGH